MNPIDARSTSVRPALVTLLAAALFASVPAACAPASAPRPPAPAAAPIRVLVFNIHAGKDAAGTPNLARVADVITESDADLVLLQEVDRGTRRSDGVDQLAELERRTGLQGVFGRTLDYQGGQYGIAVLSRWPILSDTLLPLPVDPPQTRAGGAHEPRGALEVVVDAPGGRLGVLNTHLDASGDDHYRLQESEAVATAAVALRARVGRVIVGGDLNAEPASGPVARILQAGWVDAGRACGRGDRTYPAEAPMKRIDYLMLDDGLSCESAEVLSSQASDHRPLRVVAGRRSPDAAAVDAGSAAADPATPLPPDARRWVEGTLASLTIREKAGQLVMPWVGGDYVPRDSEEFDRLRSWVADQGVGGLVLSVGMPLSYAAKLNALQDVADVPLLIASDMENGPGMRMGGIYSLPHLLPQGGGTTFPRVMALGATGSERLARELGRVVAREARAVGVHINFGPVLDVNSNPANPIINTRSFGEDPALVSRLGTAYIRGAAEAGLMTTAKHFPGHGDTSEDSHLALPVIAADRARLDTVELPPFRAAVDAGVHAIMTAHIAVRGVEGPEAPPATLSPYFMTGVLRDELGFDGLLFTDAMTMGGVADELGGGDEVLIRALEAGADVLLMPPDVADAVDAVTRAVESGRVTEARLDRSVRRILEAKARAGLHRQRSVDLAAVDEVVGVRAHTDVAREVAERSLTLVRDREGWVPLPASERLLVVTYGSAADPAAGRIFARALAGSDPDGPPTLATARVDARTTEAEWSALRERSDSADVVVVAVFASPPEPDLADTTVTSAGLAEFVASRPDSRPLVVVSFGSPYLLRHVPDVGSYLVAWDGVDASQRAAARALRGEIPITGRLPVALPPTHEVGEGIVRRPGRDEAASPERTP